MRAERAVLDRLEWEGIRALFAARARTPMGVGFARALRPLPDAGAVERAQELVAEMRAARARAGRLPIAEVADPGLALEALQVAGKELDGRTIYETVHMLAVARGTAQAVEALDPAFFPELVAEARTLPDVSAMVDPIIDNLGPDGLLADHASPELARARAEIRRLKEQVETVLSGLLKSEWAENVLRDRYVTQRNDRFVVPVRTDAPRRLPGIVHAKSDSLKTLFVEPMETVEMNNQLALLREEERQEVERILREYTEALRDGREEISRAADLLGRFDLLEATADWAEAARACRPDIAPGIGLRFVGARHPALESALAAENPPRAVVPLDVDLAREKRVLVISGPNAGGKTVALKTIGLLTLMAHAGLPLPAAEARVPLAERLYADIGDEQSIEGALSTFASHVKNLARMIDGAGEGTLALLDEIGAGTDPAEGAALGAAALERLMAKGALVVATTHHAAIKAWAYRAPGALNAACDFDDASLKPTYKLVSGVAGASIGLTMAAQLGLDAAVVEDARRRLDPSGAEAARMLDSIRALASDLETQRAELVARRRELDREAAERAAKDREAEERRRAEWERRVEQLMKSFRSDSGRVLDQLAETKDRRAVERDRARREKELRAKYVTEAAAEQHAPAPAGWVPEAGEKVFVASLNKAGVVRAVRGRRVETLLGQAVFTVPIEELRPLSAAGTAPAASAAPAAKTYVRRAPAGVAAAMSEREVPLELQLLGQRVDEALAGLERYIDDALLAGVPEVRIVHGYGTGALKKAVREYLDGREDIVSWRDGREREGGGGATVVKLLPDADEV